MCQNAMTTMQPYGIANKNGKVSVLVLYGTLWLVIVYSVSTETATGSAA